jgi:acetoin utilization protein AcuB
MTKPIPTIQKYMTTSPHTIGDDQPMSKAHQVMREFRLRHLPVMHGGKLVGLLSDRDLHLVETLRDVDPKLVPVADAMSPDVYVVAPDSLIDEVVTTMCTAFAELLHTRLAN